MRFRGGGDSRGSTRRRSGEDAVFSRRAVGRKEGAHGEMKEDASEMSVIPKTARANWTSVPAFLFPFYDIFHMLFNYKYQ